MVMPRTHEDWPRLASYVVSARIAAGFKDRRALSAASGVTDRTLGKLENGQHVSPDTLAAVEQAVGWEPDSARLVLQGDSPVRTLPVGPEADPLTPDERAASEAFIAELRRRRAQIRAREERERQEQDRRGNGKGISALGG